MGRVGVLVQKGSISDRILILTLKRCECVGGYVDKIAIRSCVRRSEVE